VQVDVDVCRFAPAVPLKSPCQQRHRETVYLTDLHGRLHISLICSRPAVPASTAHCSDYLLDLDEGILIARPRSTCVYILWNLWTAGHCSSLPVGIVKSIYPAESYNQFLFLCFNILFAHAFLRQELCTDHDEVGTCFFTISGNCCYIIHFKFVCFHVDCNLLHAN
jgi:hypothetical protein